MLRNLFAKTLFERRRSMVWWSLGIAAMVVISVGFYPTIRENSADLLGAMENMPKGMLAALGVSDAADMLTPAGYLQGRLFSLLMPLLLLVFAIGAGTRAIAGEEESRTIDMLLANPIRRSQVVLQSFEAMAVLLAILGGVTLLALYLSGNSVDLGIGLGRLAAATTSAILLALFFGTLALALGAATGKRGLTTGVTSAVAVLGYLINSLAEAVDWLKPAQKLSPFYYGTSGSPLKNGLDWGNSAVLLIATVALVAVAVATFERRDVAV